MCAGQLTLFQTTTLHRDRHKKYFIYDDFTLRTSAEGARSKRFCWGCAIATTDDDDVVTAAAYDNGGESGYWKMLEILNWTLTDKKKVISNNIATLYSRRHQELKFRIFQVMATRTALDIFYLLYFYTCRRVLKLFLFVNKIW